MAAEAFLKLDDVRVACFLQHHQLFLCIFVVDLVGSNLLLRCELLLVRPTLDKDNTSHAALTQVFHLSVALLVLV